jgi:murein DD-endopeptidase MepM/ murein hydrolase activator NlpD
VKPEDIAIEIHTDSPEYRDGLYPQYPYAAFVPMVVDNQPVKYARTVAKTPSSVWALWRPDIEVSGHYDVAVWIPGQHATSHSAQYHIHGVVGEKEPIIVEVNQDRFSNTWVSLGVYELDADNPMSGQVNLTNHTDEEGRRVAFTAVRWQKVAAPVTGQVRLADGFDAPVGTPDERRGAELWPGQWVDANSFGNYYRLRNSYNYHTGADLNLNKPQWDTDRGKPVYAVASGTVTFSGRVRNWGNIVIVRHDPLEIGGAHIYSRSAHLGRLDVERGQRVQRGQQIGTVGQDEYNGPFHLHFDLSPTEVLFNDPGDWPGLDRRRLVRDYIAPKDYINAHRPQG